ncbi:hypothetical protein SAMN02745244_01384 [Tessaracoccus bendigoensis DSM 12906]|uniref:Uncharacterized protein n=2 Tax=Tessaracoccus TaxID=72763 RepID=A0A1M6F8Z5_9ACTN|nr:hypothetical protein SAMN02745244_01384 [Tessaracoccus bendigoensis DSM 12906]
MRAVPLSLDAMDIRMIAATACCTLILAGCTPDAPPTSRTPSAPATTASPSAPTPSTAPSPSPTPTNSPLPDDSFPIAFPIADTLTTGGAGAVVARLSEVAGDLPALKLDLTQQQATLTVLQPDGSVAGYRWDNGEITRVDSDFQYLEQATFDPSDYPLDSLGRMFDVADLRGVRGQLVLQVVEYRAGQIVMTVTSRPESKTVFFRKDGTAVASLGLTSVADITAGIEEVIGNAEEAYSVSLNPNIGYSADLPDEEAGVVVNRTRPADMPTFETRRSESPANSPFAPALIDPEGLARAISRTQASPDEQCSVTIDMSHGRSGPVEDRRKGVKT